MQGPLPDALTGVAAPVADPRSHLLCGETAEEYRRLLTDGVGRVAAAVAGADRPFSGVSPGDLAPRVRRIDLDRPLGDPAAALAELEEVYLRDAVWFHHPRYLAHLNCPVVLPALLGEAVLSAVNSSLDTWDQSAGGTWMERHVIDWTAGRLGLGGAADGVFTSGGTQSNLQALLLAREEACLLLRKNLPEGEPLGRLLPRLRVLTSRDSHFSVQKSAKLLGLGPESVIPVDTDGDRRMRPDLLADELRRCEAAGLTVMAVVATAGTTDFGSLDPLPAVADLCERAGVWLHVDAAYGCGLLASPTRRHLLDGVERASSVTVDYHKSFFQPVSSSALLVRDGAVLRHATYHADYLNPARSAERLPNQVDKSLQTTRRFDALKMWLTLRIMGPDAVGRLFDEVVDLSAAAWRVLDADPRFEVVTEPVLSTLVFRWVPGAPAAGDAPAAGRGEDPAGRGPARGHAADRAVDQANLHAREALAASGEALVASTVVDGRHHLKFTLLNPRTTLDDIRAVLDLTAGYAEEHFRAGAPTTAAPLSGTPAG
ncbi:pyridoxal phosphate-dependent decarboxylase family protein [Streptomyces zingiberis]|uniref:Aspartate aminotransferase family protein n=1 Tax=Streptomyces zingiberis TaxID=2053010 RepID=A0ABX1C4X5_9ACTN|nr:aspartate aminotransferase family protein [Streptomyces zingiberis]NJQ03851.1 aspartate aminotransferase family protein [Streptomyces zingiberis]